MLTGEGLVKLLDLGLARLLSDTPEPEGLTGAGRIVGAGDYIAPEQSQGAHVDARSDIYSLGCTLYFLLAGRAPFAGPKHATFAQKIVAHAHQPAPPISQFRSDVPAELTTILDRMLTKTPDQRIQTAAEVAELLQRCAGMHDLKGVIAGRRQLVSENPVPDTATRRRPVWLAGSLVLALLASALAYWHTEIVLIIRDEGVLVVAGDKTAGAVIAKSTTGADVTLDLADDRTVRLRAGQYDIRIVGAETNVVIEPGRIEIARGRRTVVELHRAPETAPATTSPRDAPASELPGRQLTPPQVENSIGMRLAWIPAGEFLRGSPDTEEGREPAEGPQRRIRLTRPFYLGIHEVTQGQYRHVIGKNPSFYSASGGGAKYGIRGNTDNHPVETVSWEDATAFCQTLSALPAEREPGRTYRLPTEAEWEYACRAGTDTPFHYGTSFSSQQANFKGKWPYGGAAEGPSPGHPVPVGSYQPNAFGLFDMHGNVWEWCQDWHSPDYYVTSPDVDPPGPDSGSRHVIRGGSWGVHSYNCRSACRSDGVHPQAYLFSLGFRVAMDRAGGTNVGDGSESEPKRNGVPQGTR